jgi:fatty-acyl-CoA synthase
VDPTLIFDKMVEHEVTVAHMAPTVLNMLLEYHKQKNLQVKKEMRIIIAGSAPPLAFVKAVEKGLGWSFIQVYGMTEIPPLITISEIRSQYQGLDSDEQERVKAKAGYPMIGSKVRVIQENGEEVPKDGKTIGEIVTRTNGVMDIGKTLRLQQKRFEMAGSIQVIWRQLMNLDILKL